MLRLMHWLLGLRMVTLMSNREVKNIMVLGCSGGGKSTLTANLAEITRLRAVHLDHYLWLPNWVQRSRKEMQSLVDKEILEDGWITDGNHSASNYNLRVKRANMLIWVDISRWRCLLNIFMRVWKYRGRTRPSMTAGCLERLDMEFLLYVWNFKKTRGTALERLFEVEKQTKHCIRLKTYADINAFEKKMKQDYGQEF